MITDWLTPQLAWELEQARALTRSGVPVFVAYADPEGKTQSGRATGYAIRGGWENTAANPDYVNAWRPGMALCALMGHGLDLADGDPRHGGDLAVLDGMTPRIRARQATPSDGEHWFVSSMGVRSRDGVLPGIDVKAGDADGQGRGFAFIAPTVRKSKTTGELVAYRWIEPPDLDELGQDAAEAAASGLAELVRQARRGGATGELFQQPGAHSDGWTDPDIAQLIREGIRAGEIQQPILRDTVARLVGQGYDRTVCWGIWQAIVDRTGLTNPAWPWAEADFADMYDSAAAKYGARQRGADPQEPAAGRQLVVTLASSIKPRPVRWLWDDRLALGALTLLAGREGIGKSLVAVWLAAQLTRGTLPGSRYGRPSRVLFATSEDAWEFTMIPRLMAAGADLSMVGRVQVDDDGLTVGLTLPVDATGLGDYMASHDVALLILDPLTSVMDGRIDAHRDREVRTALEPLGHLAERATAAVLGLVHLGKGIGKDPVNLILGSRAFSAVARGALVAARDPDDEGSNVLSVEKSNLGRLDVPGLTYRIDGAEIPTDEGMASAGQLAWTGETQRRVRDIMADADGERTERDEAAEWLTGYLIDSGGEAAFADLIKAGRANGHAERTLKRARTRAGVISQRRGFGQGAVWQLDPSGPHSGHSGQDSDPGLNGTNGGLNGHATWDGWPAGSIGEEANL